MTEENLQFEEKKSKWPLIGFTQKVSTANCGSLYVTAAHEEGKEEPCYVSVALGKSGTCTTCMNFALSQAITIGLKYGAPVEEYVKELRGIRCESPTMWKHSRILSCPDAIAMVLSNTIKEVKDA